MAAHLASSAVWRSLSVALISAVRDRRYSSAMTIDYLANHRSSIPKLARYFFDEWRPVYEQRGMTLDDVTVSFEARANVDLLPLTLVGIDRDHVIGTGSLKLDDLEVRPELNPWLGGLFVVPERRNQGFGTALIERLLHEARRLHLVDLYPFVGLREINPVIFRAVAIQFFSLAFDDAEPFRVELIQIRGQYLKLGQQLELQFLRQRRDLSSAQFIKDDLEHQRSNINSPHPRANPGNDLPCNCSGLFSEFHGGNVLASVAPNKNNFVADLHIIDVADVDHHQIHRYPANKGATLPAHQDGGATI